MDQNERQVIDGLFAKLRQVDQQVPQRDAEAEAHIRQQIAGMPAAPYYMAQAMLVQEQALTALQSRVQQLEAAAKEAPAGGGSFLSGLFGGAQPSAPPRPPVAQGPIPQQYMQQGAMGAGSGPWGRPAMGGGFLAGAMQTAVGVAGGMLLADALTSAFSSGAEEVSALAHEAGWSEPAPTDVEPPEPQISGYEDAGYDDPGFDAAGDDSYDV
ncbi:MAG: DUF2076 domain-containing protein [Geminicoccaceae bacterium]